MNIDREQLAWAAGFWDGEGCCGISNGKSGAVSLYLTISQVPREPLDRFARAVGCGRVSGPFQRSKPHHQPQYLWRIGSFEYCQAVLAMLWPFLSGPKREQAAAALERVAAYQGELSVRYRYCPKGHDTAVVGRRPNGVCAECARNLSREYQKAKRADGETEEQAEARRAYQRDYRATRAQYDPEFLEARRREARERWRRNHPGRPRRKP